MKKTNKKIQPHIPLIFIILFLPLQPETERRLLYNQKLEKEEIKTVIFQAEG